MTPAHDGQREGTLICELTFGALMSSATLDRMRCAEFEAKAKPQPQISALRVKVSPQERDMAIRTVYCEAGDEPVRGQIAVAWVIANRTEYGDIYGGPSIAGVIRKPYAFEPWLRPGKCINALAKASIAYQEIGKLWDGVVRGDLRDPTAGATHFYSPAGQLRLAGDGRKITPDWARSKPKAIIGAHHFFQPPVSLDRYARAQ